MFTTGKSFYNIRKDFTFIFAFDMRYTVCGEFHENSNVNGLSNCSSVILQSGVNQQTYNQ